MTHRQLFPFYMNSSFLNLMMIQLREFVREPDVLFWSLVFPIVLATVLGLAFASQEPVSHQVAIIRNAHTEANASVHKLVQSPADSAVLPATFEFVSFTKEEAFLKLKRGEVTVIIEPQDSGRLVYHFDPKNQDAQLQYWQLEKKLASTSPTTIEPVRTQGSRYIDFLIPGLLAYGIMSSCIWGIGWSLIELRIKKLLRRMVATPLNRAEFLLAQFGVRLLLSLVEVSILFLFAYWFFDIRLQGSWAAALAVFLVANVAFGGIAILIAARPNKTTVGNGIVSFVTLSMMVLSGIFFSYTNFPEWAVAFIRYLPLTLAADTMRGVFNEGLGLVDIVGKLTVLLTYGAVCFVAGLRWFRWY
jgi:ABC-type polysaccharide/polyol phosphate export permease